MNPSTALDLRGISVDVETTGIEYRADAEQWVTTARDLARLAGL